MTHQNQMGGTAPINLKKGFRIHLLVFLLTIPASGLYGTSPTELPMAFVANRWLGNGNRLPFPGVFVFKNKRH